MFFGSNTSNGHRQKKSTAQPYCQSGSKTFQYIDGGDDGGDLHCTSWPRLALFLLRCARACGLLAAGPRGSRGGKTSDNNTLSPPSGIPTHPSQVSAPWWRACFLSAAALLTPRGLKKDGNRAGEGRAGAARTFLGVRKQQRGGCEQESGASEKLSTG